MTYRTLLLPIVLPLVLATSPVSAVDGVIELNDARATAGGVTPGDTPGYPLTISQPGSYRLTGDLFVSGTNSTVVQITADDVTLDLNGFVIRCLYFITPCAGNGTGIGVDASGRSNVTVRNGTVRDMGATGIVVGSGGRVENVRAIANDDGIDVLEGRVESCLAQENLGFGIKAVDAVVRNSEARENFTGIECGNGTQLQCRLFGNVMTRNTTPWSGASQTAGNNLRCDADGVSCAVF